MANTVKSAAERTKAKAGAVRRGPSLPKTKPVRVGRSPGQFAGAPLGPIHGPDKGQG